MNENLPENQFEQMISQRDELRNAGDHIKQNSELNGQNSSHRYHALLLQYHSTNTKSTLQKRLLHSMDNSASRKPANRTENLCSAEGDNEKSKHSRKHQRCMDHVT